MTNRIGWFYARHPKCEICRKTVRAEDRVTIPIEVTISEVNDGQVTSRSYVNRKATTHRDCFARCRGR
jgi:hypothetical protein